MTSEDNNADIQSQNERLMAEDVGQLIWLRLKRLTSSNLCSAVIGRQIPSLDTGVLNTKAEGVAWAVGSALGYWETDSAALNARILSRYYALLQLTIAEQVARDPKSDLVQVQHHTELGHGLSTTTEPGGRFPDNYKIACRESGHFVQYCRYLGVDLTEWTVKSNPRKWNDLKPEETKRLISLTDLFRRVPELRLATQECLSQKPLSFHVGGDMRKSREKNIIKPPFASQNKSPSSPPSPSKTQKMYIAIYPDGQDLTAQYLNSLNLPITNIEQQDDVGRNSHYFVGEFEHPTGKLFWDYLKTYKSGYCGTSLIVPFWGTEDPFILHFVILYALSIVVRYLPSLWHDIEYGDLNHIRALIEHYMVIVDHVLPRMAVERITGVRLHVEQPGSLFASS